MSHQCNETPRKTRTTSIIGKLEPCKKRPIYIGQNYLIYCTEQIVHLFWGGGGWECHLKDNINTIHNYIEKCKNIKSILLNNHIFGMEGNGGRGKGSRGKGGQNIIKVSTFRSPSLLFSNPLSPSLSIQTLRLFSQEEKANAI